ncbi:MAG: V-type ATPase 116kDa subunit family protein [Acidilobaceae archaeon]
MSCRLRHVLIALPKSVYDRVLTRITNDGIFHVEEPYKILPGSPSPTYKKLYLQASEKVSKVVNFFQYLGVEPQTEKGLVIEVKGWEETFDKVLKNYAELETFFEDKISKIVDVETKADEIRLREELKSRLTELVRYYTYLMTFREVFRAFSSGLESSSMFFIEGYVDENDFEKLKKALDEEAGQSYMLVDMGIVKGKAGTPTKVTFPPIVSSFHKITQMYGEPESQEIVPTLFLTVTFPVVFALMFPDAGHGLVLALFGLLYFGKKNPAWRDILVVLGVAAIVTGLLSGEFFGPLGGHLLDKIFFGRIGHLPPLALPTYAIEKGLSGAVEELLFRAVTVCLWVGAFMLSFGTLLGALNAWVRGDTEELIAMRLPRFLFFASIALPFLTSTNVSDATSTLSKAFFEMGGGEIKATLILVGVSIGLLWMLLGEPIFALKHGYGVGSAFISSFMEAFDSILMALGNIPSFLRILALALAHSSIMLGFYYIYHEMAHKGIAGLMIGLVLYAFGNAIAIAIEAIIAFAQTMRLHFYEWFSKFYRGTGIPFTPITLPEGVKVILASPQPSEIQQKSLS